MQDLKGALVFSVLPSDGAVCMHKEKNLKNFGKIRLVSCK
jgi:hypothetical protein